MPRQNCKRKVCQSEKAFQEEARMNIKTEFTRLECERFRRDCNFTPEERAVFDLAVQNKSNIQIGLELGMSQRTVDRRLRSVKRKIIKVL